MLGFFTQENPQHPYVTKTHMDVFENAPKATKIIHWIGSDILQMRWNCSFEKLKALRKWFKANNIIHLAEADFTQKELAEIGIKAKIVPLPPSTLYKPMPLPEEFSVAIYDPGKEFDSMYSHDFMMDIVRAMPDIKFYFYGDNARKGIKEANYEFLGRIDYSEWIPKFSCNLRVTLHDGLPLTSVQFMTAGRNAICNVPLKGALVVKKDRKQVIEAIRKAQREPLNKKWSRYWNKIMDYKLFAKKLKEMK